MFWACNINFLLVCPGDHGLLHARYEKGFCSVDKGLAYPPSSYIYKGQISLLLVRLCHLPSRYPIVLREGKRIRGKKNPELLYKFHSTSSGFQFFISSTLEKEDNIVCLCLIV